MIPSSEDDELGAFPSFEASKNSVRFEKIKTKYLINEDIIVKYTLDSAIQHSSHNWVGMFPRGFTNLQQYVMFEWTIVSPIEMLSPRQSIEFLSKYFALHVHFNQQYQFVFVSKYMEVLGASSYFYFIPVEENVALREKIHNEQPTTTRSGRSYVTTPHPCASSVTMSAAQKQQAELQKQHYLDTHQSSIGKRAEVCPSRRKLHWNMSLQGNLRTCQQCKQPKNATHICETLLAQVKSSAEHARMLEGKLQEVEQALEMSQVGRKVLQLAAQHAKRERLAYQKFLNELILSLSEKGTARIILGQGTEMLLKRVSAKAKEQVTIPKKTCPQDPLLKAIIGSQEQAIQDLQMQLECKADDPTIQSLLSNLEVDLEADFHPSNKETEDLDTTQDNEGVLDRTYDIDNSITMKDKQQQVLEELTEVLARRRVDYEQPLEGDSWSGSKSQLDPTAVVIQGDYAKFAIIRF